MVQANETRRGQVMLFDKAPCIILDIASQSPSARGGSTIVKIKYRNLLTSRVLEKSCKAGDKLEEADFEKRKGQFLYADGDEGIFMDMETYDQYQLEEDIFATVKGYLLDGTEVQMGLFSGQVVSIEPPSTVELLVVETEPAIKNATAQAQTKEAVLETGLRLQVPGYLNTDEKIKVDTRECRFVSRV